ncbi:hypothetical protein NLJ89_g11649 [Agrocybe chaxingu]|uniref:Uncharacterized protein n=1 Tax=Agrocybe chaxingu TaxID=84603 RepID=A0A9W8MRF1_9AGAR|nr:hypothetical protein NLJ89_g11649 [Agrocybe chaxingu]
MAVIDQLPASPLDPTPNDRLLPSNAVPDDGGVPSAAFGHESSCYDERTRLWTSSLAIAFVNDGVGSAAAPQQDPAPTSSFINYPPNIKPIAERRRFGRSKGCWTWGVGCRAWQSVVRGVGATFGQTSPLARLRRLPRPERPPSTSGCTRHARPLLGIALGALPRSPRPSPSASTDPSWAFKPIDGGVCTNNEPRDETGRTSPPPSPSSSRPVLAVVAQDLRHVSSLEELGDSGGYLEMMNGTYLSWSSCRCSAVSAGGGAGSLERAARV